LNTDGRVRPSAKAATGEVLAALMAIDQLRRDGHDCTADAIMTMFRPDIERLRYDQLNEQLNETTKKLPN